MCKNCDVAFDLYISTCFNVNDPRHHIMPCTASDRVTRTHSIRDPFTVRTRAQNVVIVRRLNF